MDKQGVQGVLSLTCLRTAYLEQYLFIAKTGMGLDGLPHCPGRAVGTVPFQASLPGAGWWYSPGPRANTLRDAYSLPVALRIICGWFPPRPGASFGSELTSH